MTCYEADYDGELEPAAEIEEMGFVGYDWKGKSSLVDGLIFDDLKTRDLID